MIPINSLETAAKAARIAGDVILGYRCEMAMDIQLKDINNVVTAADLAAQKIIVDTIRSEFPGHQFLCEEEGLTADIDSDTLWVIDPLDGTNNFANGIPHFSVSIAYAEKGEVQMGVVYDPSRNELFHAVKGEGAFLNGKRIQASLKKDLESAMVCTGFYYDRGSLMEKTLDTIRVLFHQNIRGLRRTGSAAIDLAWCACSRFDAFFEYQLNPWDFAAGILLVREAGGTVCENSGREANLASPGLITAGSFLIESFLSLVKWESQ